MPDFGSFLNEKARQPAGRIASKVRVIENVSIQASGNRPVGSQLNICQIIHDPIRLAEPPLVRTCEPKGASLIFLRHSHQPVCSIRMRNLARDVSTESRMFQQGSSFKVHNTQRSNC